jgi:hypothetical protein
VQLDDLHVTELRGSLGVMMTAGGASDTRSRITPFGKRLVDYVLEPTFE